ncbi:MAG TPA: FKBP-type peptidyl-prolyl cis-trans isomerase [Gemmatimonadaceae bacterium]|nr:FKBP-type peptidyl-prolyl cis-trans isomerase [Gemmatimonadaceae bacterium]
MHLRSLTALLALTVAVGCNDNSPTAVPIEQTTFDASLGVDLARSTKLPSGLYYRDITVGTGTTLATGQTVGVQYSGALANGQVFGSQAAPTPPLTFVIGSGQVIAGWDQGLPGMKVGGRRQLVIPPELAYGASGRGPIPPNAVLVFTVDAITAR